MRFPINHLMLICVGLISASPLKATDPIMLDKLPLLFADDSGVAEKSGVTRILHEAATLKQPVVKADKSWEKGRVYLYGNVVFDPGTKTFLMWYSTPKPSAVLHATSKDGLTWIKPEVGLSANKKNLVLNGIHSPAVFFDETETDSAKRYKLIGATRKGYLTAYSADGVHWTNYPSGPVLPDGDDTLQVTRDPRSGEYLCYHKRQDMVRGYKRRIVVLSRSGDFQSWSDPEVVFVPDEEDDAWAQEGQRTDVYNMAVYPHAGGLLGLPTIFRVEATRQKSEMAANQSADDGTIDVQLTTSEDGVHWTRSTPRKGLIPRGEAGAFDHGAILGVATQPVRHGDKTWVYYTGVSTSHGAPAPPKEISIGRAEWRLDGFVSLDADKEGGKVLTKPFVPKNSQLTVNADAAKGSIRGELLDADGKAIPGYEFESCTPLTQDAVDQVMVWKGQAGVPIDRPMQLALKMENGAKLYSISTRPGQP